jgi:Raf kinase inhibitor-like YbhB/YbcL family protein
MKLFFTLAFILSATMAQAFTLRTTSMDVTKPMPMKQVFNGFGCKGENISPALEWEGAPAGTKSFMITAYDPDAPTGSGWWHWTIANIPATATKIPEGASGNKKLLMGAVEGRTDFGKPGYGGACPPEGDSPHRYIFTIFALKIPKVDLNKEASGAMFGFYAKMNLLDQASFEVKFGR